MRTPIPKICLIANLLALLTPQFATANVASPSFSCSSNLVVSFENGYQASCDGDFSFTDGVLQNDTQISLIAKGFLDVGVNASLIAPHIYLSSPQIGLYGTIVGNQVLIAQRDYLSILKASALM